MQRSRLVFTVGLFTMLAACSLDSTREEGEPDVNVEKSAVGGQKWPSTMILVHGYAASPYAEQHAIAADGDTDNLWYWQGKYSDNVESYDVPGQLLTRAAADGYADMTIRAVNWNGTCAIEESSQRLVDTLDCFCTGAKTCDLVGHSTGDAIIGYVLDKYQAPAKTTRRVKNWNPTLRSCVDVIDAATGEPQTQVGWNVKTVFVAGGAGGGTEVSDWALTASAEVVDQLVPIHMRALYNHNMYGAYRDVKNVRFVGASTKRDNAYDIPYDKLSLLIRGDNDGLVPFHSQVGVKNMRYLMSGPSYDSYCLERYTAWLSFLPSCGQAYLGTQPALQWIDRNKYQPNPLFDGYVVQMLDRARLYNHSDEVGRLAEWITSYKDGKPPWVSEQ